MYFDLRCSVILEITWGLVLNWVLVPFCPYPFLQTLDHHISCKHDDREIPLKSSIKWRHGDKWLTGLLKSITNVHASWITTCFQNINQCHQLHFRWLFHFVSLDKMGYYHLFFFTNWTVFSFKLRRTYTSVPFICESRLTAFIWGTRTAGAKVL